MSADTPADRATDTPAEAEGSPAEVNARGAAQAREKLAQALAQAKADAARRGRLPRQEPRRKGPRRGSSDPQPFGRAIRELLAARGWEQSAAVGGMFGRWAQIVGPDLAAHTRPGSFEDGEVVVVADSTAWATQVRLLAATLVRRMNEELGEGSVRRVRVRGPSGGHGGGSGGGTRQGGLRVRGGRGSRDTYG